MSNVDVSIHTISIKDRLNPNITISPTKRISREGTLGDLFFQYISEQYTDRDHALQKIADDLDNQIQTSASLSKSSSATQLQLQTSQIGNDNSEQSRRFLLKKEEPTQELIRPGLNSVYGFIEVCSNGDPAQVTRALDVNQTIDISAEDFYHRSFFYMLLMPEDKECSYIFLETKHGKGGLGGLMLYPFENKARTASPENILKVNAFSTTQVFQKILNEGGFEKLCFEKRTKQYSREDGTKDISFEIQHKTTVQLPGRKKELLPWIKIKNHIFKDEEVILEGYEKLDYDRSKVTLTLKNGKKRTIDLANHAKGFIPNYELENVQEANGKPMIDSLKSKTVELFDDLMQQL